MRGRATSTQRGPRGSVAGPRAAAGRARGGVGEFGIAARGRPSREFGGARSGRVLLQVFYCPQMTHLASSSRRLADGAHVAHVAPFAGAEELVARAAFAGALQSPCGGCAPPSTRRAVRSVSSSVVTASRRSSSVAPGLCRAPRVIPPHPEREFITLSENAPRHGHRFAQQ